MEHKSREPSLMDQGGVRLIPEVHHWIIEEANGPTSEGRCTNCGAEKTFRNWLEELGALSNKETSIINGNI